MTDIKVEIPSAEEINKQITDLHQWTVGPGIVVTLKANAPLSPQHFDRLIQYVNLAKDATADLEDLDSNSE